jgi:hypothetical protein
MSALLLDNIVDKHAIDIEPDYLKIVKVSYILVSALVVVQTNFHCVFEAL